MMSSTASTTVSGCTLLFGIRPGEVEDLAHDEDRQ